MKSLKYKNRYKILNGRGVNKRFSSHLAENLTIIVCSWHTSCNSEISICTHARSEHKEPPTVAIIIPNIDVKIGWVFSLFFCFHIFIIIIFCNSIAKIGEILIILELFYIFNRKGRILLFFSVISTFPLFLGLYVVSMTFSLLVLFYVADDIVLLTLLWSSKLDIYSP